MPLSSIRSYGVPMALLGAVVLGCGRGDAHDDASLVDTMTVAPPPVLVPADSASQDSLVSDTAMPAPKVTTSTAPPPRVDTPRTDSSPPADTVLKPNIDPRPAGSLPRIPREATTP